MLLLDIMACEWTNHLFFIPGLIAVSLGSTKAAVENISKSKELGINRNVCNTNLI